MTKFVTIPGLSRYDTIFLAAVEFQICALVFRFEEVREFAVILIFDGLATAMELLKSATHPRHVEKGDAARAQRMDLLGDFWEARRDTWYSY